MEAVRVAEDLVEGRLVQHHAVVVYPDPGAARRSVQHPVMRIEHVAHQEVPLVVGVPESEYAAASARIAVVEAALDLLAPEVAVGIELSVVGEEVPHVGPQLDLVVDLGRPPHLRRGPNVSVARLDQRGSVGALRASVGGLGVSVLAGQVQEAGLAERQADVARQRVHLAVAGDGAVFKGLAGLAEQVSARLEPDRAAGAVVLQHEIHDARYGIGAVLGGRTVAQHLGLLERQRGNGREVGTLGAVGQSVPVPGDDRRAVTPLPR